MAEEKKKLLILRACGLDEETQECENLKNHAELYDIEVRDYCPKSNDELRSLLKRDEEFDYIYLSSHGNEEGFCNEDESVNFKWHSFGVMLCGSMCLKPNCVVMLSCCRGGLNQVAFLLFYCCPKISYIVGPRQDNFTNEMLIAFNLFLFNTEHRQLDPVVACEKIKLGTDIRFVCFDRLETEGIVAYSLFIDQLQPEFVEEVESLQGNEDIACAI